MWSGARGHSTDTQGARDVSTKKSLSEIRTRTGLARRKTKCLDPGVCLRSADCLFGARETTSSTENHGRREHIGEIKNSHSRPTSPKHGVARERPPPSRRGT